MMGRFFEAGAVLMVECFFAAGAFLAMECFFVVGALFVTFMDLFFINRIEMFVFNDCFFYMGDFGGMDVLYDFLLGFCFNDFLGWALYYLYFPVMAFMFFLFPAFTAFMGHMKSSL